MHPEFVLRLGVALLLITSGLLKLLSTSPAFSSSFLSTLWSEIPFVLILWELYLAAWLFLGKGGRTAWMATIATFGIFLIASATLALQGVTNCGCMGDVPVNPWTMVVIDAAIVALALPCLAYTPPQEMQIRIAPGSLT